MAENQADPMQACDDLSVPMGQLLGGVAAMPNIFAGALAAVDLNPVLSGVEAAGAVHTYDSISDAVANNWHDAVCVPLEESAHSTNVSSPPLDAPPIDDGFSLNGFGSGPDSFSGVETASSTDFGGGDYGPSGSFDGGGSSGSVTSDGGVSSDG